MSILRRLLKRWTGSTQSTKYDRQALLPMPPRGRTEGGEPRRIGVEIEFTGLKIDEIAEVLRDCLGGEFKPVSDYEKILMTAELGDWRIELDNAYLKRLGRESAGTEADASLQESLMKLIAEKIVPFEVVSAPLPMNRLSRVFEVIRRLGAEGAKGTRHATVYAFGIHMNPEMPALDADTVRRYLQAFLCLQDWLKLRCDLDFSRRITPYIDSFPAGYIRKLLAPDYAPDLGGLIDDYLDDNPTRNRALDMLPLFAHLDEARVRDRVDDHRIQARPTLHYRLPNCLIDEPNWNFGIAWRDWLQVEYLAEDPRRLERSMAAYGTYLGSEWLLKDWPAVCSRNHLLHELF